MEEVGESETNRLDGLGEDLANNLLDNTTSTSVFIVPNDTSTQVEANAPPSVSVVNKLGSTITDIINNRANSRLHAISLPEKGIGKTTSKYTLRIKSCGSALAEDGYKWRKYGQKTIKNSPNPR